MTLFVGRSVCLPVRTTLAFLYMTIVHIIHEDLFGERPIHPLLERVIHTSVRLPNEAFSRESITIIVFTLLVYIQFYINNILEPFTFPFFKGKLQIVPSLNNRNKLQLTILHTKCTMCIRLGGERFI